MSVKNVGGVKAPTGKKVKKGLKHSPRARENMTNQLKARRSFLKKTLESQTKELAYTQSFVGKLPKAAEIVKRVKKRIAKTNKDIKNLNARILKLQKEGKINKII